MVFGLQSLLLEKLDLRVILLQFVKHRAQLVVVVDIESSKKAYIHKHCGNTRNMHGRIRE